MEDPSPVTIKWSQHSTVLSDTLKMCLQDGSMSDVTLVCEGVHIRAHRLVLAAASRYFRNVLQGHTGKNVIIVVTHTKYEDLKAVVDLVYEGKVVVDATKLKDVLETAEMLQVAGSFVESKVPVETKPELDTEDIVFTKGVRVVLSQLDLSVVGVKQEPK